MTSPPSPLSFPRVDTSVHREGGRETIHKTSSVCLSGVRFESVKALTNGVTGERVDGGVVLDREGWFGHLSDAQLWRLVGRGVITFADGERFRVLGFDGDGVDCNGWEGVLVIEGVAVGVGCGPVRGVNYDLSMVRCVNG